MNPVQVFAVENLPLIKQGDNLGKLIVEAAKKQSNPIQPNDVVVVTHVVVSKAEGNVINLDQVKPSEKAKEIAQKLQMNYVFGREFQELTQGPRASPAYHGQATLSRWPLSNPRVLRFQNQSNFWRPRWFLPEIEPFQERIGGRLALVCETAIAGKRVVTYNLHLESKGDDALRCSQIEETLEDARRYEASTPIVLAGEVGVELN